MLIISRLLCLIAIMVSSTTLYAFNVYGFVPWSLQEGNTLVVNQNEVKKKLEQNGIQRIDVVYHNRMLTNGHVDSDKIKKIAIESQANPNIPISFDLEIGKRNQPETILPRLLAIIDLYHAHGGKAPIGVYATLPQNTFGGAKLTEKRKADLVELNKQYEIIASKIDFISPVLYFYDGENLENWKKAVDFNLDQSKELASKYNLKIYPYITNSFRVGEKDKSTGGWTVKLLDQNQMKGALDYLEKKGADGVIVWASSQVVNASGSRPVISENSQWLRGIKSFTK